MSEDDDDLHQKASQDAKNLISSVVKDVTRPASVELVGRVYDNLITVRDLSVNLLALLAEMPLTQEQSKRLKAATNALSTLQAGIGNDLALIARDAFEESDEPKT